MRSMQAGRAWIDRASGASQRFVAVKMDLTKGDEFSTRCHAAR
jgi:hypothetical protein